MPDMRGIHEHQSASAMTDQPDPSPESADAPAVEPAPVPDPVIAELTAENADLKDRLLRTLAEMENLRKRAEREAADARAYAVTAFARDVLSVSDNLARALEAVPAEGEADAGAARTLADGVALTARDLDAMLARHGVQRLDPKSQRFDPNLHQAMMELEDASVPAGTVVQVMQSGYTISGRVLRPAMVAVSRGGPKPGAGAEPSAASPVDKNV
jgi:molecular chaperone GrpE